MPSLGLHLSLVFGVFFVVHKKYKRPIAFHSYELDYNYPSSQLCNLVGIDLHTHVTYRLLKFPPET